MVCCGWALLATLLLLLATLLYLRRKKGEKALGAWRTKLHAKYHSFEDSEIYQFDPASKFTDADIADLKERLRARRINDNLEDPDNSPYGTPVPYVTRVAEYWAEHFDFASVSRVLGQFKHYKTVIGDLDLHFIHMVGREDKKHTPILLLHGFPSTVWEFHKSIPILHQQGYTVVVPSLPGHGFTNSARVPGVSPAVIACTYNKLMNKLGYNKYVAHGGDWGAIIGKMLAYLFPDNVLGFHLTMNTANAMGLRSVVQTLVGCIAPSLVYSTKGEEAMFHPLSSLSTRTYRQWAYFHIQSCLPDTFGYGMVDSPVALIGWHGMTYPICATSKRGNFLGSSTARTMDGIEDGIEKFGMDNICAQLSIFWCMRNAQSAMRIYYEFFWNDKDQYSAMTIPNVPVAVSDFPNEILHLTEFVTRGTFHNLQQFTHHDKGGHFAHIDATDLVVQDIDTFIAKL